MSKKSNARQRKADQELAFAQTLPGLLAEARVGPDWDVVIVSDGSGCGWEMGAGWASVVCMKNGRREFLTGAARKGTVSIAELMGPLYGLMWFDDVHGKAARKAKGGQVEVHVFSDSQFCCDAGNADARARGAVGHLWAAWRSLCREGYDVTWHWRRRDTIALNSLCDHASREARLAVEALTVPTLLSTPGVSEYDFTPAS